LTIRAIVEAAVAEKAALNSPTDISFAPKVERPLAWNSVRGPKYQWDILDRINGETPIPPSPTPKSHKAVAAANVGRKQIGERTVWQELTSFDFGKARPYSEDGRLVLRTTPWGWIVWDY
jgi:hypothetical protein